MLALAPGRTLPLAAVSDSWAAREGVQGLGLVGSFLLRCAAGVPLDPVLLR